MKVKKGIKSFKELEPNKLVQNLVIYIEKLLPEFTSSSEFVDVLATKKNENQHSTAFCLFMTNRCYSRFCFLPENAQKGNRTIDIGIYKGSTLFFTIEAKLLPTPSGTYRKKHEYVYGKGGGIQRFKDENHGVDNQDNLINENGLIAYIKEKDFQYWHTKINKWILDTNWNDSEKLEIVYFEAIAKLKSLHPRISGSKVFLHHFWVLVNNKSDSDTT